MAILDIGQGYRSPYEGLLINMSITSVDPLRYYDLEFYLFNDVNKHFHIHGSIGAFDFFSIVVWKANRAKSKIAARLITNDHDHRTDLECIVRDLTTSLSRAIDSKERLKILIQEWGLRLPMASAILTVLWPDTYTLYDGRVCGILGDFQQLRNKTEFERIWSDYARYVEAVRSSCPTSLSLRDADRYLWAKSAVADLDFDIKRWPLFSGGGQ